MCKSCDNGVKGHVQVMWQWGRGHVQVMWPVTCALSGHCQLHVSIKEWRFFTMYVWKWEGGGESFEHNHCVVLIGEASFPFCRAFAKGWNVYLMVYAQISLPPSCVLIRYYLFCSWTVLCLGRGFCWTDVAPLLLASVELAAGTFDSTEILSSDLHVNLWWWPFTSHPIFLCTDSLGWRQLIQGTASWWSTSTETFVAVYSTFTCSQSCSPHLLCISICTVVIIPQHLTHSWTGQVRVAGNS